jgi:hypothetical protein
MRVVDRESATLRRGVLYGVDAAFISLGLVRQVTRVVP